MPSPRAEARDRREREDHPGPERPREARARAPRDWHPGHDRVAAQRRAVREPGASPGRSRRCEGRCSSAGSHWPSGREGGGGGSPESEDLPPAANPNPSRKEDSCFDDSLLLRGVGRRCSRARPPRARRPRARARRGQDADDLRLDRADARGRRRTRSTRSRPPASPASSTTTYRPRSGRTSTRSAATRRRLERLGVQGQRRLAAGRRRPGRAQGRRHRALVLRDVHRAGGPPTLAPEAARGAQLLPVRLAGRRRASRRPPRARCSSSTGAASRRAPGAAASAGTRGLVRATAPGAVRSNALR